MNFDYEGLINNYENGNISIFKSNIQKMNKLQLSEFIIFWCDLGKSHTEIMETLKRYLGK